MSVRPLDVDVTNNYYYICYNYASLFICYINVKYFPS